MDPIMFWVGIIIMVLIVGSIHEVKLGIPFEYCWKPLPKEERYFFKLETKKKTYKI